MKAAFWGIAIVVFGFLGIFLISLFGNITVTNQQDYTLLKKSVEAESTIFKYERHFLYFHQTSCQRIRTCANKTNGKPIISAQSHAQRKTPTLFPCGIFQYGLFE